MGCYTNGDGYERGKKKWIEVEGEGLSLKVKMKS